jgi:uncharacterized membrane protein (DUF485 family)
MNQPPAEDGTAPGLAGKSSRIGLALFAVYLVLYGGFMGLSAFAPALMGRVRIAGVNLAILYGLGLILAAVALALLYLVLCRRQVEPGEEQGVDSPEGGR